MIDLSVDYMGIPLKNPLVASSSPLCTSIDNIKKMEDEQIAAVILQSLFEEQVILEQRELDTGLLQGTENFAEALTYLPDFGTYRFASSGYLEQIRKAKEAVDIPVIGSLNGISTGGWIKYAKEIQDAGADALELNLYYLPTRPDISSQQVENNYVKLVKEVTSRIQIPAAIKISFFLSSIPDIVSKFADSGASALVLFNRFYQPDLDLESLNVVPNLKLSTSDELRLRIRWIAILYNKMNIDMAITGGVHTSLDVLKGIASGAKVTMMTSAFLINGIPYAGAVLEGISQWLERNDYKSIRSFQGILSQTSVENPEAYERANYMQVLGSFNT